MKRIFLVIALLALIATMAPAQNTLLDGKITRGGTTTDTVIWSPYKLLVDGMDSVLFQVQLGFASTGTGTNGTRLIIEFSPQSRDVYTIGVDTTTLIHDNLVYDCITVAADSLRTFNYPWWRIKARILATLGHQWMPYRYRVGLKLKSITGTNGRPYKVYSYVFQRSLPAPARILLDGKISRSGTTGDTLIKGSGNTIDPYTDSTQIHVELGFVSTNVRVILTSVVSGTRSKTDTLALTVQETNSSTGGQQYLASGENIVTTDSVYDYVIPYFLIKQSLRAASAKKDAIPINYEVDLFIPSTDGTNGRAYRIVEYPFKH